MQPDGKIMVAGHGDRALALTRYLPIGTLDAPFGVAGKVVLPSAPRKSAAVAGVALQSNGKIAVVSNVNENDRSYVVLQRFWP